MVIGIDCSRAFVKSRTGTENYSYFVVSEILRLPESRNHHFILFVRPNAVIPRWIKEQVNVEVKEIKLRYLWTQIGLAVATWSSLVEVLWVPAHTLPVLRKPGVVTVVTIHGLEYEWLSEYRNLLQRWYLPLSTIYAARRANKLIAVSKFTKKQLIKRLHTSSERIKVIHEGVRLFSRKATPAGLKEMLAKWGVENGKYILFVGTLMPRKNLPALIKAFSLINREFPDMKLVIAGGRGWFCEEIFRAPLKHEVQEKVVFTGRVSETELSALYQGAKLYVQPSITEGFGLPILEAMQAGVPVVSSSGGALAEVVGDSGLVVELGVEFASWLGRAMKSVIGSRELQTELVEKGKKRVGELTWKNAAAQTLDTLVNTEN